MTNSHRQTLQYRPDLDGLRCFAVCAVILAHTEVPGFSGGFVGVDVFFVLSGFLITAILATEISERTFTLIDFYERRARRILPALIFLLLSSTAFGFFLFPPWQMESFGRSMAGAAGFVSNFHLLDATGGYFGSNAKYEPLLHTWSLSVEEQFYVVFPIVLLIGFRMGKHGAIATVAILTAASLTTSVIATNTDSQKAFFLPHLRAWELGFGSLLALASFKAPSYRLASACSLVGAAFILAPVFLYSEGTSFPGAAAIPVILGTSLIIWSGGQAETAVRLLLSSKPIVWVGKISYSLYLWHWPPLVVARTLGHGEITLTAALFSTGFAFLMAWLSWRFVERPYRKSGPRSPFSRGRAFRQSAIAILAILGLSWLLVASSGLSSRIPSEAAKAYLSATAMSEAETVCQDGTPTDPSSLCRLGRDSSSTSLTTLLWGDSHAGALTPGFEQWLSNNGRVGSAIVKSGCPPALYLLRLDSLGAECLKWNDDVISFLRDTPSIRTVILASRWPLFYHGTRPKTEAGRIRSISIETTEPLQTSMGKTALEGSVRETLRILRELDITIYVLGSVPEIGWNVPKRLLNYSFIRAPHSSNVPRIIPEKRFEEPDAQIAALSEGGGATFMSVANTLCSSSKCPITRDGHILYRDDDHLSEYGARLLFPLLFETVEMTAPEPLQTEVNFPPAKR